MVNMFYGRRMFITEAGHLGLGPGALNVGDSVAVLLGGMTPFVLRGVLHTNEKDSASNRYQLVGECYTHGMMNGEIIGRWKAGQFVAEDIVLVYEHPY
jgi:hypothetical protein